MSACGGRGLRELGAHKIGSTPDGAWCACACALPVPARVCACTGEEESQVALHTHTTHNTCNTTHSHAGAAWNETWTEKAFHDAATLELNIERTARKWAKGEDGAYVCACARVVRPHEGRVRLMPCAP